MPRGGAAVGALGLGKELAEPLALRLPPPVDVVELGGEHLAHHARVDHLAHRLALRRQRRLEVDALRGAVGGAARLGERRHRRLHPRDEGAALGGALRLVVERQVLAPHLLEAHLAPAPPPPLRRLARVLLGVAPAARLRRRRAVARAARVLVPRVRRAVARALPLH